MLALASAEWSMMGIWLASLMEELAKKSLGCWMLFREAIGFGYRFGGKHAVMLHLHHSLNASLCKKNTRDGSAQGRQTGTINEGLEAIGIRYGYSF